MLLYVLNFLDRTVINIVAEPIKQDLGLLNWQIGLMSGLAFALFYTVLGVPIARAAEKHNRPLIIASAAGIWSAFTVLCGMAQNFWQLALARVGVGIGEAGCTPPAHSLITDYTPKEKRASALAFYTMGIPLGSLVGMAMGGLMSDAYGWRMAFLVAGAPGLILAVIAAITLKEPRNHLKAQLAQVQAKSASFGETLATLRKKPTFWLVSFAAALKSFIGYGQAPFIASFFLLAHGEQVTAMAAKLGLGPVGFLGLLLGLSGGLIAAFSTWIGGQIADHFGARDLRAYMSVPAIAAVIFLPVSITGLMMEDLRIALPLMLFPGIAASLWYGPTFATAQGVVEPHMRATSSAILLFISNMVGLAFGPLVVGILIDIITNHQLGMEGLDLETCKTAVGAVKTACMAAKGDGVRYALLGSGLIGVLTFALYWRARRTIREDMVS